MMDSEDLEKTRKNLRDFSQHLENTKEKLLDSFDNGTGYLEKFNIVLTINGKTITLDLNADIWSKLKMLIDEEIKEIG